VGKRRFLNYGRQRIEEDDIAAVNAVLRSDFLTQGPSIDRFEAAVAERVGAKFAVAVSSGTAALHLACLAAGLGPGQRGITSALTFVASANAMIYCGADAMLGDVDPQGLALLPSAITAAVAVQSARLVMPVHFAGLAWASKETREAAKDAVLIEDACHAFGGRYADGEPIGCGKYADMTVFSFHPVKPITSAEGGLIATNDRELDHRLRSLRSHGIERDADRLEDKEAAFEGGQMRPWYYEQQTLGYNYRLTDLQAALGLAQLAKLDRFIARRRQIAARFDEAFSKLPYLAPIQSGSAERARSALHLYVLLVDFPRLGTTRKGFMERLRQHQVGSQVHYIPVYRQPYHARLLGLAPASFPATEAYYERCLSLPLHHDLNDDEVENVITAVQEAVAG
jgi:perosamine synthetase